MPLCGFTDEMLASLKKFNSELIRYGLEQRSQENSESIEHALRREISDMSRLLMEIDRIDDSAKRVLTEGMVKYALGFYLLVRKSGIKDAEILNKDIIEYFRYMDDVYYASLEGKSEDMRELADLLNEKKVLTGETAESVEQIAAVAAID